MTFISSRLSLAAVVSTLILSVSSLYGQSSFSPRTIQMLAGPSGALPISTAQKKRPTLQEDAESVLGKINYARARELTQQLQHTLRKIRSYDEDLRLADDPAKRQQLEQLLNDEIDTGVKQTQELLALLQDCGFDKVVFEHKEELTKGFSRDSIPPYEKDIFENASFSDQDFAEFVAFFKDHGYEVLSRLEKEGGIGGIRDHLATQSAKAGNQRYRKAGIYIKIFGGAVGVGGDILVGVLIGTAMPPAAVIGAVASTGAGLSIIGDGVNKLGEEAP